MKCLCVYLSDLFKTKFAKRFSCLLKKTGTLVNHELNVQCELTDFVAHVSQASEPTSMTEAFCQRH